MVPRNINLIPGTAVLRLFCHPTVPSVECSIRIIFNVNPFRTAVPFWGQTTWNLSGLSPQRDRGSKGVKHPWTSPERPPTGGKKRKKKATYWTTTWTTYYIGLQSVSRLSRTAVAYWTTAVASTLMTNNHFPEDKENQGKAKHRETHALYYRIPGTWYIIPHVPTPTSCLHTTVSIAVLAPSFPLYVRCTFYSGTVSRV